MHDLSTSQFLPIAKTNGVSWLSLPAVYAELVSDTVESFPGLAVHQAQAWYQFLVQAGALALQKSGRDDLPTDHCEWREYLLALTPECTETAWSLVVEDTSKPAFLQPPTNRIDEYKLLADTPDGLQVLVTAKNHDRKQGTAVGSAPHHWLFGLIEMQTMNGFSGRGNYGIARMNGGLSSRVMVDRRPNARWGPRVCRAIRMLLARRGELLEKRAHDGLFRAEDGIALSWLENWDTDAQLCLADFDPYFIEVCRRIRLATDRNGRLAVLGRPSNKPRVDARLQKGNLADPWIPIKKDEASALTVSANGFDYRLAQRILLQYGELQPPVALKELPGEAEQDSEIHMVVLVRGQGKTEGLHERTVKLPHSIRDQFLFELDPDNDDESTPLAVHSTEMIRQASEARRVLRQAILVYLQGPESPNFKDSRADPFNQRLDGVIDAQFFGHLFAAPVSGFPASSTAWQIFLKTEAYRLAEEIWAGTAAPSVRREKARAASEAVLWGGLRRQLPDAFRSKDESKEEAA